MDKLLKNKNCIITGSGRGMGRAMAVLFAQEGARVVINDIDELPALEVVSEIEKMGGQAVAVAGDITSQGFPAKLIAAAVKAFGPDIDILVNNAGYLWNALVHKMTDEQWSAMLDILATAPFKIIREAAPYMRGNAIKEIKQHGSAKCRKVVNITSIGGIEGSNAGIANYSAAKAAVIGLSRSLAKEWGPFNICVNCVAPGMIETRIIDNKIQKINAGHENVVVGTTDKILKVCVDETPLGRLGRPEDVANTVLFLASPLSDFITDEVIRVTGGMIMPYFRSID